MKTRNSDSYCFSRSTKFMGNFIAMVNYDVTRKLGNTLFHLQAVLQAWLQSSAHSSFYNKSIKNLPFPSRAIRASNHLSNCLDYCKFHA